MISVALTIVTKQFINSKVADELFDIEVDICSYAHSISFQAVDFIDVYSIFFIVDDLEFPGPDMVWIAFD